MSNLTVAEKLIREFKAEPLEGHTVVVLERVGESGEKFHSLLEPGDEAPRQSLFGTLLGKTAVYFAYAVDASKSRSMSFSEQVEMAERAHGFELHFSLWYRVTDPQLLVSVRDSDPLERIRKNVIEVVTGEIAELPWAEVWHSFRVASESVVSLTFSELKSFARDYGIQLTELRLRGKFPPGAVETDRKIHEARERGRLDRERIEVAQEIQIHRSNLRRGNADRDEADRAYAARRARQDALARATTGKLEELIGTAGSVHDLRDIQFALQGGPGEFPLGTHNGQGTIGAGNGHPAAALAAGGGDTLAAVLSDLVLLTRFLPDGQCRRIRGSLLRLVAEAVADDSIPASSGAKTDRARQAQTEIRGASLPADRLSALCEFANPERLHERLYP